MEKQVLLKNILVELSKLPEEYLQHWYGLIHAFRENLPEGKNTEDEDFDWDGLVEEVMKNRRAYNLKNNPRTNIILNED